MNWYPNIYDVLKMNIGFCLDISTRMLESENISSPNSSEDRVEDRIV